MKIDKNVPMPNIKNIGKSNEASEIVSKMKVGDSVAIPFNEYLIFRSTINRLLKNKFKSVKVTYKKEDLSYRMWRYE